MRVLAECQSVRLRRICGRVVVSKTPAKALGVGRLAAAEPTMPLGSLMPGLAGRRQLANDRPADATNRTMLTRHGATKGGMKPSGRPQP